jgi:hypothetical protein
MSNILSTELFVPSAKCEPEGENWHVRIALGSLVVASFLTVFGLCGCNGCLCFYV